MFIVSPCPCDAPELLALVDAMTAELVTVYGLAPEARPAPLASEAQYLLLRQGTRAVGCCAVQPIGLGTCELKRMFVSPAVRGTGAADVLLAGAERQARGLGGGRMQLETGVLQPAAMRLYERAGYRRIANYPPHEQDPQSVCYAKALPARPPEASAEE